MKLTLSRIALVLTASLFLTRAHAAQIDISLRRCFETETQSVIHYLYLHDTMIVEGSDTVFLNNGLLRSGQDYVMDYADGLVYFVRQVPTDSHIRILYRVPPPILGSKYCLRQVEERYNSKDPPGRKPLIEKPERRGYDIRASGAKSVSFEAGSLSDVHVSQALDLKLSGNVGGVDVKAVLSDRDMAVGDAGATSRLKDLDQIFIEVSAENAYARVGDLEVRESPGELLSVSREGTGFYFKGFSGSKYFVASGAASRTKSRTVVIQVKEGISGPYQIPTSSGAYPSIVRSSEQVFLDGRKLRRGKEADYVIDYEKSEIYLNPRITIRGGSRLMVTYDLEDGTDKQLYYLASGTGLGKRAKIRVTYVAQSMSKPLGLDPIPLLGSGMTDWKDGGKFVGMGKGSYIKVTNDSTTYYLYVGEGSGDYDVRFTEVGEGKGSYSYIYSETWQKYVYVFTGVGSFVDRVPPKERSRSNVVHLGATFEPARGVTLESEIAQSSRKGKPLDEANSDADMRAYRILVKGESPEISISGSNLGKFGLVLRRRMVGSKFDGLDRQATADFYEKWAQEDAEGMQRADEVSLSYCLGENVSAATTLGRLTTDSGVSTRKALEAGFKTSHLSVVGRSSRIEIRKGGCSSVFAKELLGATVPLGFGFLDFGRTYDARQPADTVSIRRYQYYGGFERSGSVLKVSGKLSHSIEQRAPAKSWKDYLKDWTARASMSVALARKVSFQTSFVHRILDYDSSTALPDMKLLSSDLHLDVREIGAIDNLSLDYGLTRRLTSIFAWELVKLNGVGDYDSLGNYVPGAGGYGISRRVVGSEPANHSTLDFELQIGKRAKLIPKRSLSATISARLEAESKSDRFQDYAIPIRGENKDILLATTDFRQEVVYRGKGRLSLRLGGRYFSTIEHRFVERRDGKRTMELSSKLITGCPFDLVLELEGRIAKTQSYSDIQAQVTTAVKRESVAGLEIQRSIASYMRAVLDVELCKQERWNPKSDFLRGTLKPGFSILLRGIRWDNFCKIRRMLRSNGTSSIYPLWDSVEWNSRMNLRRGSHVSLSFEYSGMKIKGSPVVHNMRSSLTASF